MKRKDTNTNDAPETQKKKKRFSINIFASKWLRRNRTTLLLVGIILVFFIAFKFECFIKREKISQLKDQLAIVKTEAGRQRSAYMSETRESIIVERADSLHLGISIQKQPPYTLSYDD